MSVRTLTEVMDRNDTTITTVVVGPEATYVELTVQQWELGEEKPDAVRVLLEIDDAIALRDAMTAALEVAKATKTEE